MFDFGDDDGFHELNGFLCQFGTVLEISLEWLHHDCRPVDDILISLFVDDSEDIGLIVF